MGKKKKKEKVVYIDDGRTISDMSGVGGVGMFGEKSRVRPPQSKRRSAIAQARASVGRPTPTR